MVFALSGRMKGGGGRGVEGALGCGLQNHRFGLTRRETGRSRRGEVSKRSRGGWDATGELSGVRPRVDVKGKRLREPATNSSDSKEEVHRSHEYIFFGAERCRSSYRSSSVEREAVDRSRQKWAKSPLRRALRTSYETSFLCDSPDHAKP